MTTRPEVHLRALARAAQYVKWHEQDGESIRSIAKREGISRQRAQQVIGYGRMQRDLAQSATTSQHED